MKKKTSKIEFKLEEQLFNDYKSLCENKGFDMSKRLRLFIEYELKYNLENKDIISNLSNNI